MKCLVTMVHEFRYDCPEMFCHVLHFLFSDNLDDDTLGTLTIEFTVEDTLPRTSIEATFCNGDHYLGVQQQVLLIYLYFPSTRCLFKHGYSK